MSGQLKISLGQYSDKGRKETNQDFHGACIPDEPQLSAKGIAIALADGISSSNVSQVASQSAVRVFLEDYYCTSPAWSVKKSAQQVLMAINSWLYAQTQQSPYRYEKDRGYVCTMSALVLKSTTAHLFHAGDARIYRLRDDVLEQLTHDHRVWVSSEQSYLSRALGIQSHLDIDYQSLRMEQGDVFLFATDGVHEFANARFDDQRGQGSRRRPRCGRAADRARGVRSRQRRQSHRADRARRRAARRRTPAKFTGSSPSCRFRRSSCRA